MKCVTVSASYAIIAALISKRYIIFSSVSVNSAFGASKAELAGTWPLQVDAALWQIRPYANPALYQMDVPAVRYI